MNDIITAIKTREPLAVRAAITAIVTALAHAAVSLGWIDTEAESAITAAIDTVGALVLVLWARRAVTPTADPRADDGTPLAPVEG